MHKLLYRLLIAPRAANADDRRQEFILSILLLGVIGLALTALLITVYNNIAMGASYRGASPFSLLIVLVIFLALYAGARYKLRKPVAYVFIFALYLAATIPLATRGLAVMQTVIIYSFIVVMTGVLISTAAGFIAAAVISSTMLALIGLSQAGTLHAVPSLITQTATYGDGIACTVIFVLIALVSWLANRDIRYSLLRAQASEAALKKERDNLEVKVRERTKQLEKAQMERTLQLQRFAEFGRVSATLIHDLASPLTAVSLSLSQLEDRPRTGLLEEAKQSAAAMERYVVAARQQLQHETDVSDFDPADEIRRRIVPHCNAKAKQAGAPIELDLASGLKLHGSSVQFDHIVSNLIVNAIDAYDDAPGKRNKAIRLALRPQGKQLCLTVRDHGVGIQKHQLPRIFDAFYTTKYDASNLGLGLSMVKHIVETGFCGTIAASSSPRGGTCFTVKAPLA